MTFTIPWQFSPVAKLVHDLHPSVGFNMDPALPSAPSRLPALYRLRLGPPRGAAVQCWCRLRRVMAGSSYQRLQELNQLHSELQNPICSMVLEYVPTCLNVGKHSLLGLLKPPKKTMKGHRNLHIYDHSIG